MSTIWKAADFIMTEHTHEEAYRPKLIKNKNTQNVLILKADITPHLP